MIDVCTALHENLLYSRYNTCPVLFNLVWVISLVSADHTRTLNTLTSHPSAVNNQTFTGDVVTRSRSKEDNGTLKVFRRSPSAGRNTFEDLTSSVLVCYESFVHLQIGHMSAGDLSDKVGGKLTSVAM